MANIIQIKRGTGSSEPSNGSLAEGELAINLDSGKLFYGSGSSVLSDFKFDKLTTETHVISSSVTYMTTSFSSGSTAFGDTADDTHTFTGAITASGNISASGDIIGQNFTSHDIISTTFTGSVDNPAIRFGPLAGNLAGNKVGLMMEELIADTTFFVPYFVANGAKIFGFGTLMDMKAHIQMNENKIMFDGDSANTFIYADTSTPENIEIHADGNIELRADDDLQVYSDVDITGEITASGNISSSGNVYAADYFDNGANINTIYSPIASPTFTGTVAIPNIANVETAITANTAKATNVSTNLTATTHASQITINSSDGDNVVIAEASDTIAGVMTVAHHDKLDGIEASATADQSNAEIRTAVEAATDSNVFTDADHTKLNGIEASATADQTQADINGLAITTVGDLGSGTIASGFGNIDNGSSTLDTGALTATTLTVPTRVYAHPGTSAGDHTAGDVWYFGGTTGMTAGLIYYLNTSGTWTVTNCDAAADSTGMLAVALGDESDNDGMLLRGFVTLYEIQGTEDHGKILYLNQTDGGTSIVAPTTSGHVVRIIGYSLHNTNDSVYFNPDNTWVEIA